MKRTSSSFLRTLESPPAGRFIKATGRRCDWPLKRKRLRILAINKIDRLKNKDRLLPLIEAYKRDAGVEFQAIVPISAKTGHGTHALLNEIAKHLGERAPLDPDALTDRSLRFLVSELIRESAILATEKEVPYGIAVAIDEYVEELDRTHILATLIVENQRTRRSYWGRAESASRR